MPRPDPTITARTAKMVIIDRILDQSVYGVDSELRKRVRFDLSRLSTATVEGLDLIVAMKLRGQTPSRSNRRSGYYVGQDGVERPED